VARATGARRGEGIAEVARSRPRLSAALFVIVSLLATLVPLPPAASASVTYRLAVAVPLSQGATALGSGILRGASTAVRHYNATTRFQQLGLRVDVASYDDQGDPKTAVMKANAIAADSAVLGVVGHLNSGCSIPASKVYEQGSLAMVSPASSNPALTLQGLHNVYRTIGIDPDEGSFAGTRAAAGLLLKRAVVVDDSTPYGETLADAFVSGFKAGGGTVLRRSHTSDKETTSTPRPS
jgi:branched-chain amino acid transport system substrate-binding protein